MVLRSASAYDAGRFALAASANEVAQSFSLSSGCTFMSSMLLPLKRYADFDGRSTRKEYWMFFLFQFMVGIVINVVSLIGAAMDSGFVAGLAAVVGVVFALAMLVPGIAVSIRRLHDIDKSGWQLLWGLVPIAGAIIILVFMVTPSTNGSNRFGPAPAPL